jgi:hypothetical protein
MRRCLLILFAVWLTACATLGLRTQVSPQDLAGIDRIGVVSVMGDRYHTILLGLTSQGNRYHGSDVSAWDLDGLAVATAVESLTGAGDERAAVLATGGLRGGGFHRDGDYRDIDRAGLLSLAAAQGFDTLLLIRPAADDNAPDRAGGYGYHAGFGIRGVSGCSYVQLIVEVLRVRDGHPLGWEWVRDCDSTEDPGWRGPLEDYTATEAAALRARAETQVRSGLRDALQWLGLTAAASRGEAEDRRRDEPPPGLFRRD